MAITELEQRVLDGIIAEEVVGFLQGLVRIRSVYPPGDCVEAAHFCANKFAAEGIQHEVVADLPEDKAAPAMPDMGGMGGMDGMGMM